MHLLLDTNGLILKKRNNCFFLISKSSRKIISPIRVSSITVAADCLISASALSLAVAHQVPVFYTNRSGKVFAKLYSKRFVAYEALRIKQTFFQWMPESIRWVKENLILKTQLQNNLIKEYLSKKSYQTFFKKQSILIGQMKDLPDKTQEANRKKIRNIEAQWGANYWKVFYSLIPGNWKAGSRNTRPAQDPVNACINYFYGFNYSLVEHAIYLAGLNPYQGLFHQNQYNEPVLSFDLIEPFRPLCDRFVLRQFKEEFIIADFFEKRKKGVYLNRKGKQILIPKFFDYLDNPARFAEEEEMTSYKNHIYRYANQLRGSIEKIQINDFTSKL